MHSSGVLAHLQELNIMNLLGIRFLLCVGPIKFTDDSGKFCPNTCAVISYSLWI
jgi:hypothetical protein